MLFALAMPKSSSIPVVPWIGIIPASLSSDDGVLVASQCQNDIMSRSESRSLPAQLVPHLLFRPHHRASYRYAWSLHKSNNKLFEHKNDKLPASS
ncbi:uncharacterized protein EI90DRAFT_3041620 [Cantharellus anzutake]|uniref:uncharacterized protein n=1 Tax=Cantharellus anzutake TaxID=1750568 RepID=UPI0019071848|nr:uncharacterized protein EI90DRAFT_3041620 [Cantharellus anzutake]KAF8338094.1 hypothetical protein EI90DRAFT_3041620 [Cantharellus anzutake]